MSDKMVQTPLQRLKMLRDRGAVLLPSLSDSQRVKALFIQNEPSEIARMKDEQLRKHLPRMFSLIKNESWGLEDDQIPS